MLLISDVLNEVLVYICVNTIKRATLWEVLIIAISRSTCIIVLVCLFFTTGAQRDWFLTQLRADVDFLLGLGVLDYSLLLGRHPLKTSDRKESVPNLVLRMKQ